MKIGMPKRWLSGTARNIMDKIPEHNKLLIVSFFVGICSGLAAVILLKSIHLIKGWVSSVSLPASYGWQNLIAPGLGMLLSLLLLRYVIKDNIGHGVTKVLVAVSKNKSRIRPHNMWSSVVTSAVTIGFGGSVGAEAPIVYTGAAIGSNFARFTGMSYRNMTILLGCGAAGAVAGIFKAPLAGVLFTMEILLFNISMTSMLPLLISSISATVVAYIFMGDAVPFQCTVTQFSMGNIPFYIVLGICGGLCSMYFIRMTLWLEDKLGKMKRVYLKWLLCALGLGLLIFLFPMFYGEGYDSLDVLLNGSTLNLDGETVLSFMLHWSWGVPLFFLLVLLLKVVAMTLTNAGGGVGGTFGPTLFVGAILGFVVARMLNLILLQTPISVPEQNFVLVGMAALMAGVMQAPMTAIFLIAETTGGYQLLIPLIMTSTISYGTTRIFEKYSIYTKRIAKTGELLTHDNDQAVLTLLKTSSLVKDKYPRVRLKDKLRTVVSIISQDNSAVMAVVDGSDRFIGLIDLDSIRSYMFKAEEYDTLHVYDIMESPLEYVYYDEPMDSVMRKFDKTNAWRLPVIDRERHYKGFVSRSRILSAYRQELKVISQD